MQKVDFNDLVIRKNYMDKLTGKDVSEKMLKFKNNISMTSSMMFDKYHAAFDRSGYNQEDILILSKLYAHYYFDLYSDEKNNDKDDRNGLITFIRQRMNYLAFVCQRNSDNFHASKNYSGFYAKTSKSKDLPDDVIISNPTRYGYRKISIKELREIKKLSKNQNSWKDKNGFDVVKLEYYDFLSSDEYKDILYENSDHFKSAEEIILENQKKERIDADIINFKSKTTVDKIRQLNTIATTDKSFMRKKSARQLLKILKKEVRNERNSTQI
jgi:hypothetical protein